MPASIGNNNITKNIDKDNKEDSQNIFDAIIKMTVNDIVALAKLYIYTQNEPSSPIDNVTDNMTDNVTDNVTNNVTDNVTDTREGDDESKEMMELELKEEIIKKLHTFMNKLHEHQSMLYLNYISGMDLENIFKKPQHSRSSTPDNNHHTIIPKNIHTTATINSANNNIASGAETIHDISHVGSSILNTDDINVPGSRVPIVAPRNIGSRPYHFNNAMARHRYTEMHETEMHRLNKLQEARDRAIALQMNRQDNVHNKYENEHNRFIDKAHYRSKMVDESDYNMRWKGWMHRNNTLYDNAHNGCASDNNIYKFSYNKIDKLDNAMEYNDSSDEDDDKIKNETLNWHEERRNRWNDTNMCIMWDNDNDTNNMHKNMIHKYRNRGHSPNSPVWHSDDGDTIVDEALTTSSTSSSSSTRSGINSFRNSPIPNNVNNTDNVDDIDNVANVE